MTTYEVTISFVVFGRSNVVNLSLSSWGHPTKDQIDEAFLRYWYGRRGECVSPPPYHVREVIPCCG